MASLKEYMDEINKFITDNPELADLEVIEYNYIRGAHKLISVPSYDNVVYLVTNTRLGTEIICYSEKELKIRFDNNIDDVIKKVIMICKR